jgi:catechol 2,3-dioxygenase-like lactoylglutathione lyase family enzyme
MRATLATLARTVFGPKNTRRAARRRSSARTPMRRAATDERSAATDAPTEVAMMDFKLEVVTLPVSDVDRAVDFYTKVGFDLDVDYHPASDFRVVQMTPRGSASSIQFGVGLTDADPGTARATYLVVSNVELAYRELTDRGVELNPLRHKEPVGQWHGGMADGIDPDRRNYATFTELADPDGNTWVIQEIARPAPAPASGEEAQQAT